MDTLGDGQQNSSDPSYTSSGSGTISTANITGAPVVLADPNPLSVPGSNPTINVVSPTDQGVVISYGPVTTVPNRVHRGGYIVHRAMEHQLDFQMQHVELHVQGKRGRWRQCWILNNGTSGITGVILPAALRTTSAPVP